MSVYRELFPKKILLFPVKKKTQMHDLLLSTERRVIKCLIDISNLHDMHEYKKNYQKHQIEKFISALNGTLSISRQRSKAI